MSGSRVFLWSVATLGALAWGWCVKEDRLARRNEAEAARLNAQAYVLAKSIAWDQNRTLALTTQIERQAKHRLETSENSRISAALKRIAETPWRDVVLEQSSELQMRYLAVKRFDLESTYGPFLENSGLTPEQKTRFQEILLAAEERLLDLKSAIQANGWAESDPAVQAIRTQSQETLRSAQQELLGQEGYRRLVDYDRALPAQLFVRGVASTLTFADQPLSSGQVAQLTQILADASDDYRNGGKANGALPEFRREDFDQRQAVRSSINAEQTLAAARALLSPAQYTVFAAEVERGQAVVELYNLMRLSPDGPFDGFVFVGRK